MGKVENLEWYEVLEIADVLTKVENPNEDYAITENALFDKWNINLEQFHEIVEGIFQMINFGISPITQTPSVGISKEKKEWIAKKECEQQFISAMLHWLTDGDDIPKGKGFVTSVTKGGKKEFDIMISRSKE